jgi:hemerythrin
MPIVAWDASLSVGNNVIDEHHRHLVGLLNKAYDEFCDSNSTIAMESLLEELIDYATYHFAHEEKLMTATGYPETLQHLEEHERFVKRVTEMQKDVVTGDVPFSLEILSFLKNWLVNHISKVDTKLGAFAGTRH